MKIRDLWLSLRPVIKNTFLSGHDEPNGQPLYRIVWRVGCLIWRISPWYVTMLITLEISAGLIPVFQLYLLKLVMNGFSSYLRTGNADDLNGVVLLVSLQAASGLLASGMGLLMNRYRVLLNLLIENTASSEVLVHANSAPLSWFEDSSFYDALQRAVQASNGRAMELLRNMFQAIRSVVVVGSYLLLLWSLGWWVSPLLFIAALPGIIVQNRYERKLYEVSRELTPLDRERSYFSYILESDWLIHEIKLFNIGPYFLGRYRALFDLIFSRRKHVVNAGTLYSIIAQLIGMVGIVFVMIYVLLLTATHHKFTIGDFSMYTGAVVQFAASLYALSVSVAGAYKAALFFGNLVEFIDTSVSEGELGANDWTEEIRFIEFQSVGYRYSGRTQDALSDICFTAHQGQILAIVGANGSGKTTLSKLILHLYRPTSGRIFLNGKDSIGYSVESIHRQMTAVFQKFGHYELSARENVTIGRIERTDFSDLSNVLIAAGAEEVVSQLPRGLDTRLGKWFSDGVQISTGQWQRLALARALQRDGAIFVMDEPTSGADVNAEEHLFKELRLYAKNRIMIVITHRMSLACKADRIVVLDNGCMVEEGAPNELLAKGGRFSKQYAIEMEQREL